jgi:expansin (peptidoglycan-binding protein)
MKNKTPKKYIVQRYMILEYEMTALTKKELLDMPRSDYNTYAHTKKIEKSLHVRRKI